MGLLADNEKDYLKEEFKKINNNVEILFFYSNDKEKCEQCDNIRKIINEIKDLSDKIIFIEKDFNNDRNNVEKYNVEHVPALVMLNNKHGNIKYYGVPSGYEFSSFIDDIIDIGSGNIEMENNIIEKIKQIDKEVHIKVFVTPTCPYCPGAVRTAHKFAMLNNKIKADMIEAYEFGELADKYQVSGVPRIIINEKNSFVGSKEDGEYLQEILKAIGA